MRIHFIVHEVFLKRPAPICAGLTRAAIRPAGREFMPGIRCRRMLKVFDMLVVLGGPQSPRTTLAECPWFDAHAEKNLIARAIAAGRIVVGICLGSQLIGEALGAPVMQKPGKKEIGHYPIILTTAGLQDDNIAHFGSSVVVGHWHNDMPGLTPAAEVPLPAKGARGKSSNIAIGSTVFSAIWSLTRRSSSY